jgi:hypothetical protein
VDRCWLIAVVIVAIAALVNVTPALALPPAPPGSARSERALDRLTVAKAGPRTGDSRDTFGDWNALSNHCDTRELVVQRDGTNVAHDTACHATSGRWRSFYDNKVIRDSSKLDIDHIVPLANAWISGARAWTGAQREAFANDLRDPQLIAVSFSSNRSKGDSSPDEWKPPRRAAWCLYSRWWIDVKTIWKLAITAPERDALAGMLATC